MVVVARSGGDGPPAAELHRVLGADAPDGRMLPVEVDAEVRRVVHLPSLPLRERGHALGADRERVRRAGFERPRVRLRVKRRAVERGIGPHPAERHGRRMSVGRVERRWKRQALLARRVSVVGRLGADGSRQAEVAVGDRPLHRNTGLAEPPLEAD